MSRSRERTLAAVDDAIATEGRPAIPHRAIARDAQDAQAAHVITLPSTEVQNEFGRILDRASRNQDIVITRHNVARAVLISADRYRDLVGRDASVLESLRGQLDALYAGMQTPEADAAADRGFNATPQEMGRAAVEAARAVRRSAT